MRKKKKKEEDNSNRGNSFFLSPKSKFNKSYQELRELKCAETFWRQKTGTLEGEAVQVRVNELRVKRKWSKNEYVVKN